MYWQQFTHALRDVARRGTLAHLPDEVSLSMHALGMVIGNETDAGGVVFTDLGRQWYQRVIIDRENERLLAGLAVALDSAYGMDGRDAR